MSLRLQPSALHNTIRARVATVAGTSRLLIRARNSESCSTVSSMTGTTSQTRQDHAIGIPGRRQAGASFGQVTHPKLRASTLRGVEPHRDLQPPPNNASPRPPPAPPPV